MEVSDYRECWNFQQVSRKVASLCIAREGYRGGKEIETSRHSKQTTRDNLRAMIGLDALLPCWRRLHGIAWFEDLSIKCKC